MATSEPTTNLSGGEKPNDIPKEWTNIGKRSYDFIEKYLEDALDGKKDDFALSVILKIPIRCLHMMFYVSSHIKTTREDVKETAWKKIQKRGRKENQRLAPLPAVNMSGEHQVTNQPVHGVAREVIPISNRASSRCISQQTCGSPREPSLPLAHSKQLASTEKTTFGSLKQPQLEHTSIQNPPSLATDLKVDTNDILILYNHQFHDECQANTRLRASSSLDLIESITTSPGSSKEGTAEQDGIDRTGASIFSKKRPISMTRNEEPLDLQRTKKVRTEELPTVNQAPFSRCGPGPKPETLPDVFGEDNMLELPGLSSFHWKFT